MPIESIENAMAEAVKEQTPLEGADVLDGDDTTDLEMEDYPLDSLLIRSESRSIHEVYRRITQGQYIMDPDFQRDFVWPHPKQSKLVESILMRIPLPVFYLAERHDGKIIVIDGLQRLTTITRYLEDKFSLRRLDKGNAALNGMKFSMLSTKLQNRIEDTQLILYLLDEKVPDKAKFDIFQRVNEGTPLSRQQMRNCVYSGEATRFLKQLAAAQDFLEATAHGLSARSMRDREVINRFMAFQVLGWEAYKGDMDLYLGEALDHMNHSLSAANFEHLSEKFLLSMRNNFTIWNIHAFRKHEHSQSFRNIINIALFDVLAYALASVPEAIAAEFAPIFRENLFTLLNDRNFSDAITNSTNGVDKVHCRFAQIKELFPQELLCYTP